MDFLYLRPKTFRTKAVAKEQLEELNSRQALVTGFNLNTLQHSKVLIVGAGALGSHVARALVRKGAGRIDIVDDDFVSAS